MPFKKTDIKDLFIFEPKIFYDQRGYFFESYNKNIFKKENIEVDFVQDNQSYSKYGTVRGFQTGNFAQSKLIRVLHGEILDIVVDIRKSSDTFGKIFSIILSKDNQTQMFIPKGLAHGFSVLSKEAEILYKCDNFYNQDSEQGIRYNDLDLNINWGIPRMDQVLSEKDINWQSFKAYKEHPCF